MSTSMHPTYGGRALFLPCILGAMIKHWAHLSEKHFRVLGYTGGSLFITVWTVLRFYTSPTIFDLVGQQVLTAQLLRGQVSGAAIGVTNYIPKMVLLYIPLQALPGSPRLKLLILTVIVNIATIILLGLVLERLLKVLGIKIRTSLYAGLIWLGAISGSVFWVQFTNSRNLEVVGGLFLLYQGVCYLQRPTSRRLGAITAFAALLFFTDSLQLYMSALPLIIYGLVGLNEAGKITRVVRLSLGLLMSLIGSKAIFWILIHCFSLHILSAANHSSLSFTSMRAGLIGSLSAVIHLYAGGADAGKWRELANIAFLGAILLAIVYGIWRKFLATAVLKLVTSIIVIDTFIYILSGQAQQADTQRYLIMTVPAILLLFSSLHEVWDTFKVLCISAFCVFVLLNGYFLVYTLAKTNHNFSQDAHLASVNRFIHTHPRTLNYASMDTALPIAYLYADYQKAPLPLGCRTTGLYKTNTFYGLEAYHQHEANFHGTVAIILDGSDIHNKPTVCSAKQITTWLGQPKSVTTTDDQSTVLLYGPTIQQKLHF